MAIQNNNTNEEKKWYVVSARSGHEKKVKQQLEQRVYANGMDDVIEEVLIPMQEKIVAKGGKKEKKQERVFPGYILIKMILNDDSWQLVRTTDGITGFVMTGETPEALEEEKVEAIKAFGEIQEATYKADFSVGQSVKVINGNFKDFIGKINEINEATGQVSVLLSMFGQEVPTLLDFEDVTTLSENE